MERCGKVKEATEDDRTPAPRLLKIFMKDQRTRKDILSKAVNLRQSNNEHVKNKVKQRIRSNKEAAERIKKLRDHLKELKRQNPLKRYKIYRGEIKEIPTETPMPQVDT